MRDKGVLHGKLWGANKGLGEAPKSCTRKEHESATNSIAKRGQGAIAPCRVKGQRPLWGLGQRPNCSTGDQYAKRAQQRCRQRSVPASNFARPQTRPQAALSNICAVSRQMGATMELVLQPKLLFCTSRGFAPAGATKGLSDRPLETFGSPLPELTFVVAGGNRACGRVNPAIIALLWGSPHADGCKNHPNCDQKMKNPRKRVIMLAQE